MSAELITILVCSVVSGAIGFLAGTRWERMKSDFAIEAAATEAALARHEATNLAIQNQQLRDQLKGGR